MLPKYLHAVIVLLGSMLWLAPCIVHAQQSVLSSGNWYKFSVEQDGVYKINRSLLKKAGIDPAATDPRTIRIFGNAGGMLPQPNSEPRPNDLTELAIYVHGEEDGAFDNSDYILFYAQGPGRTEFMPARDAFYYEKNLYADHNFYFLTAGGENGKRIAESEHIAGTYPVITQYNNLAYYELDQHNQLQSGREWFGEKFDITTEYTITWNISGIVENSPIKIVSDVMARSYYGSSFKLFYNDQAIGEQYVLPVANARYAAKGKHRRDTIDINAATVSAAGQSAQKIKYQYTKSTSGTSVGYLDLVLINHLRKLALYGDQTIFRSAASLNNSISTFEISQAGSDATVWSITTPEEPAQQQISLSAGTATFSAETSTLGEFIVFNKNVPAPVFVSKVANQDLHSAATPNLLIVTNPLFRQEAERLAQHRRQHSGWSVAVVTTEEIYHEFSSGRQDVTAIRDYAKYLYDKDPGELKALLLMGRGSYDFKDRISNNTNFVPTYESRNSLHPLETYSSDDYFGFLEDSEGNWGEESPEYHSLDVGVGRLPVKTVQEARHVVDKIIHYETSQDAFGRWRKRIVFVADDGDNNLHQSQADQLAKLVADNHPAYDLRKIYLDAYTQVSQASGESAPEVNKRIEESLDKGSLIINYTGHGGEKLWAQERIFDDFVIEELTNQNFPLFVTATCEFGRQDDPAQISSAELCVLRNNSGAIGMVTTARPVNSSTNLALNKAFYNVLFTRQDNAPLTLGEIFRQTKNNSISGVSNRNFSLIGDPSLTLAFPKNQTLVTEILTDGTTDTLKALSHVTIKGMVVDENQEKLTGFTGRLQAEVYDKETEFTTLGNENDPAFTFKQWHNALFRGQAEVTNGEFAFEFIMPKNIAYQLGEGKLSLYAYDPGNFTDAGGATFDFVVGRSAADPGTDSTPPAITLYMADTTFVNGGLVGPSTRLLARLADASGITISDYGIGNNIMAILDGEETFVLNDYYEADVNDFTRGWVSFPMKDLSPGRHTLVFKAWDTFNNPGEAAIDFVVSDSENLTIEIFGSYPNPFLTETTLYFTHNSPGDDLQAVVSIYDVAGKLLKTREIMVFSSPYHIDLAKFGLNDDFGEKLKPGLYFARVRVRSLSDGSKNERVTKLIMTN